MASDLKAIEAQALQLSADEKVRLADRLIASIFEDHDIESAWAEEVERRIAEIEGGRSELVPAAESVARARASIK
jgi:putative addiction module component (TIGR02574 family)